MAVETIYQSLSSVYDSQVLVATHSPVFLGCAQPERDPVLCQERRGGHGYHCRTPSSKVGGLAQLRRRRSTLCFRGIRVTMGRQQRDLFVLVADQDMYQAMRELLARGEDLGIRSIRYSVDRHLQRDPGCRTEASRYHRHCIRYYRYALVVFDREGCGDDAPRGEIQHKVERNLERNGWNGRSKAIVIDPELEAWVWGNSQCVSEVLGWGTDYSGLRNWLYSQHLWPRDCPKTSRTKRAMQAAMQCKRVRKSARKFSELAARVRLSNCQDPAFTNSEKPCASGSPQGDHDRPLSSRPPPLKVRSRGHQVRPEGVLVELHAQTGPVGHEQGSVPKNHGFLEHSVAPWNLAGGDPLQDERVGNGGHDVCGGHGPDGSLGVVRRDGDLMGFGQRTDFLHLRDAADVDGVGLRHVDGAGPEEVVETVLVGQAFGTCDGVRVPCRT